MSCLDISVLLVKYIQQVICPLEVNFLYKPRGQNYAFFIAMTILLFAFLKYCKRFSINKASESIPLFFQNCFVLLFVCK